jgi:hypothetical protein
MTVCSFFPSLSAAVFLAMAALIPTVGAADVLFLGGNATPTSGADGAVMSYLENRYGTDHVDYRQSSTVSAGDEAGYDVVVLSSTSSSPDICGKFDSSTVGVVNWERVIADNDQAGEFSVCTGAKEDLAAQSIRIVDGAHPITAGFSAGQVVEIFNGTAAVRVWWSVSPVASGAQSLAEDVDDSSHGFLTIVDEGGMLMSGSAAAGRRVMFGIGDTTFSSMTEDGKTLFGQAVDWAAGGGSATAPTVVNSAATGVGPTSATLGGEVTDTGGASPVVTLYWGGSDGGTVPGDWEHSIDFGAQSGAFSSAVSGLSPSTLYYFRCHASNSGGEDWADASGTFTTASLPDPPAVANAPATGISHTQADLRGTVTDTGGEAPNVTIYYGPNDGGADPATWASSVNLGAQSGDFLNTVFFLDAGTTYYFRAYAENSGGAAWAASSESFTTLAYDPPAVENAPATSVTGTSARIGGAVTDTGGQAPSVTVYWGTSDGGTSPTGWQHAEDLGQQSAEFSVAVSGLAPTTTYYFRCFAQNDAGDAWADATGQFATLASEDLVISEFMAANDAGQTNNPNGWWPIPDQIPGTSDDWIEIHNTGLSELDLGGWHLTDDAGDLTKWTFPAGTTIPGGGYLIVYASKQNAPDANGNLHTNFKLSADGEYLALTTPSGGVASEFAPGGTDFPPQSDDISYGLHPSTGDAVFFSAPTPGAPNDAGGVARTSETRFSPDRGFYQGPVDVAIATDAPGATIYYTTDGMPPVDAAGTPVASASVYSGPIHLSRTTVVRAVAVKTGYAPSKTDTHTYILLDIEGAAANGTDPGGMNTPFLEQTRPPGWGNLASGDYNMDPNVSKSTAQASGHATTTAQTMLLGMRDIPTVSIALDRDDFAGPDGIYSNPEERGEAWERACSAEFIPAAGDSRGDWQENCGLRVQGGASRLPRKSPKHSLSFRFRSEYGAGKLHHDLFPDSPVKDFNVISLRAGYNNSWIHSFDANQRLRASMIRDQWIREAMLEMDHPSAGRGFMVHVFVNGLYWGVHNLCERHDASHYAEYNGYDEDLIDARNGADWIDGNATAWNEIAGVVNSGDWEKIQQVIDIDQYIDYQIINRYGGNHDLKTNGNWRAAGGGPFPAGEPEKMAPWQLYPWDSERTLEGEADTISPLDPMGVRGTLENNPEYRMRFADRLQKHFFNGGALTPDVCKARWMKWADTLDRAIIAESARWGDTRRTPAYTRDAEWLAEQQRLVDNYFPARSTNVLNGYASLFPDTAAPAFEVDGTPQHGGEIPPGSALTIAATSGDIYYTTDGSDPRLVGGAVNPNAVKIAPGTEVTLAASGTVRTRTLDAGEWSAMEEAVFYVEPLAGPGDLAVTEIHYHPYRADALEQAAGSALPTPRVFDDPDDFEFIEIQNISPGAVNLDGVRFTEGIDFTFGNLALPSGGYAVVARDAEAFGVRYSAVSTAGSYSGKLSDKGELVVLAAAAGDTIQAFTYDNSGQWPGRADGKGSSLEIIDPAGNHDDSENWRASSEFHGTPGAAGTGPDGRIVVNEVLTHTDEPALDAIELHNTTGAPIDITGWLLSDSTKTYPSFAIPATTIPAGGYITFDENDFNAAPNHAIGDYSGTLAAAPTTVSAPGHGLSTGEVITIEGYGGFSAFNGSFEVTALDADHFTIDTPFLDNDATKGNWISGRPFGLSASRGEDIYLMEAGSSGGPAKFIDHVEFAAAFNGETLGRWPNGSGTGTLIPMLSNTLGAANSGPRIGPVVVNEVMYHPSASPENHLEFVEIHNSGSTTENLAHWRLRGGADFDFTAAHSLAPGGLLVLVAFDPVSDPAAVAAFRAAYGIDTSIPLAGPFTDGPLGNDTGTVRLQRPDSPPTDDPDFYPQVTEDEVIYQSTPPWPSGPAGGGQSLDRAGVDLFGNFASSWTGHPPTPGGKRYDYGGWTTFFFGPGAPAGSGETDDPDHDNIANILEYALDLNPLVPDPSPITDLAIEGDDLTLSYTKQLLRSGIAYRVEMSTDMENWTTVADDAPVSTNNFTELRKARVPIGSNPRMFLRLAVDY